MTNKKYINKNFGISTNRRSYKNNVNELEIFDLLSVQKNSFKEFIESGIGNIFEDVYPIYSNNKKFQVQYIEHFLDIPKDYEIAIENSKSRGSNFSAPLKAKFRLINNIDGSVVEEDISFIADIPLLTDGASFIINGSERVIISQIVRAPSIYFENMKISRSQSALRGSIFKTTTFIFARGIWIELEYSDYKINSSSAFDIKLKVDRSKKVKLGILFYALGLKKKEILDTFYNHELIVETLNKVKVDFADSFEARQAIFKAVNFGDRPTKKTINEIIYNLFFNNKRIDLSETGRYKINKIFRPNNGLINLITREAIKNTKGEIIIEKQKKLDANDILILKNHWDKSKLEFTKLNIDDEMLDIIFENEELNPTKLERTQYSQVHLLKLYRIEIDGKHNNINVMLASKSKSRVLTISDLLASIGRMINLEDGIFTYDDIDSLENKKIKSISELLKNQIRLGLLRIAKNKRDRLGLKDTSLLTIKSITNHKLMESVMKDFFNSSQLSQFMDQVNPLSEISNKRRITSLGPSGLSRETASLVVRSIHKTHYGRIDPIETPEGPNIGLIVNLATYARINKYGILETPYYTVKNKVINFKDVKYLTYDEEINEVVLSGLESVNENNTLTKKMVVARINGLFEKVNSNEVTLADVSSKQITSIGTSLIPFLEHNDANRALMGANMQRQAVPLIKSSAPIVATEMEQDIAKFSPTTLTSKINGTIDKVDSKFIKIINKKDDKVYKFNLRKFVKSNQGTLINQIPRVRVGQKVKIGQILADGPSVDNGELAIGKNIVVAFSTWRGYNYEDAIVVSKRLVKDDVFTSIHIVEHKIDQRVTKLGLEEITSDIPNSSKESLRNLDENGIVLEGSRVRVGDILVGKNTPKRSDDLSPEEKLLNAILGNKSKNIKDTSLRVPYGAEGIVQKVKILSKENGDRLDDGIEKIIKVYIAQKRKIKEGDKMSGRHGNKGVVSVILPEEDMPYLDDGQPIDILLNPLGVPSRMNFGQVLELHFGMAAYKLGKMVSTPIFNGIKVSEVENIMKEAGMSEDGKFVLTDGITGEKFENKVAVGIMYMLKLSHMIDDKMHARSIGPYSLITQQPLRGKSQNGGQRFGEMETWAIEAYGASNILREMITLKSDDIKGRNELYNAIAKGKKIPNPNIPEGFWVLFYELRGLGLNLRFKDEDGEDLEIDNTI